MITEATIERAVIGIRSVIEVGSTIRNCVMMGADYFDSELARPQGAPAIGVGRNCHIENAIIDKNARIGDGAVIRPDGKPDFYDGPNFFVRDGIVVIPKDTIIPPGTVI